VLARIEASALASDVPHFSIYSRADQLVPAESAVFTHGGHTGFDDLGHNAMLFDTRVIDLVVERILAARTTLAPEESRPSLAKTATMAPDFEDEADDDDEFARIA
jgi:hypothetical protein